MQELLNRSPARLWGIVSNGLRLRLVRDNVALTRQAYLEFDLEAMMTGEVYSDFVLLWLVCHQSRVEGERPDACWLEQWTRVASSQGAPSTRRAPQRRRGRDQQHSAAGSSPTRITTSSMKSCRSGDLDVQDYYRQLLRLVYRLLFLFVAEDRDALLDPDRQPEGARELPRPLLHTGDCATRRETPRRPATRPLRISGRRHGRARHRRVRATRTPCARQLPLVSRRLGRLADAQLANADLLSALRSLAWIEERGVRRAVDFRNLGAEELGSVYESLLELQPELDRGAAAFTLERRGRSRAQDHRQLLHTDLADHRVCSTPRSTHSCDEAARTE